MRRIVLAREYCSGRPLAGVRCTGTCSAVCETRETRETPRVPSSMRMIWRPDSIPDVCRLAAVRTRIDRPHMVGPLPARLEGGEAHDAVTDVWASPCSKPHSMVQDAPEVVAAR